MTATITTIATTTAVERHATPIETVTGATTHATIGVGEDTSRIIAAIEKGVLVNRRLQSPGFVTIYPATEVAGSPILSPFL